MCCHLGIKNAPRLNLIAIQHAVKSTNRQLPNTELLPMEPPHPGQGNTPSFNEWP